MTNPFEKRATEYLRDDAAFLSVVTPEPLNSFFEELYVLFFISLFLHVNNKNLLSFFKFNF